jgi:hypothetical protein
MCPYPVIRIRDEPSIGRIGCERGIEELGEMQVLGGNGSETEYRQKTKYQMHYYPFHHRLLS